MADNGFDFKTQTVTLMISALAFVAAFFWNDAVKTAIEQIVPPQDAPAYKFAAALVVTIIVVVATYILSRFKR